MNQNLPPLKQKYEELKSANAKLKAKKPSIKELLLDALSRFLFWRQPSSGGSQVKTAFFQSWKDKWNEWKNKWNG